MKSQDLTKLKLAGGANPNDPEANRAYEEFLVDNKFLIEYLGLISDFVNDNIGIQNAELYGIKRYSDQGKNDNVGKTDEQLLSDDYFFSGLLEVRKEYDYHLDGLKYKCPPFTINIKTGPDTVCLDASDATLKLRNTTDPALAKLNTEYIKTKIEKNEIIELMSLTMKKKLETLKDLGYDFTDGKYKELFGSKLDDVYKKIQHAHDEILKSITILENFEKLCTVFGEYDNNVLDSPNRERLKKICGKNYKSYANAEFRLLESGAEVEKIIQQLKNGSKISKLKKITI